MSIGFVLVFWGCFKKNAINWMTGKEQKLTSRSSRAGKSTIIQHIQSLVRTCFLVHRWLSSCYVPTSSKGQNCSLESLLYGH